MLCFMHNLLYRICSCPWRHSQLEPLGIIHILRNMHILSLLLYMNHICKISYIVVPSRTLTPSTSSYTYIQKWINMYVCMCIYSNCHNYRTEILDYKGTVNNRTFVLCGFESALRIRILFYNYFFRSIIIFSVLWFLALTWYLWLHTFTYNYTL